MAGHRRTVDTGTARRTASGKTRRVRQHRAAGESATARRDQEKRGARALVEHRIRRTKDPMRQLDIARDYVRSAAAKYQPGGEISDVVDALLTAGDRIYSTGNRKTRR